MVTKNTQIFIEKAKEKHGTKYDYSKVEYINAHTKVCIICPKHGEFWQTPNNHLSGKGCQLCSLEIKRNKMVLPLNCFISKANEIHHNKYDYSKVNYINAQTKVCIICPEHGEFWQTPNSHLNGRGCPKCDGRGFTTKEWVDKANNVHNWKYDYSKVEYNNATDKVCIICPEHGEFWQTARKHLYGQGCPICSKIILSEKLKSNTEEFIRKAINVHGSKYNYSKVNYVNNRSKVCIICPTHGEFWQRASAHLYGQGCEKCKREKIIQLNTLSKEDFIEKVNKVHNFKYDYSQTNYVNGRNLIKVICPEHGEFWQRASNHLCGIGCPKCSMSHMENELISLFNENKIIFEHQKHFDWLKKQTLDFYLPDYNIAIECQGMQHFVPQDFFGGEENLLYTKTNDIKKRRLCEENNVKLLYYANYNYEFPYEVITNKSTLVKLITE